MKCGNHHQYTQLRRKKRQRETKIMRISLLLCWHIKTRETVIIKLTANYYNKKAHKQNDKKIKKFIFRKIKQWEGLVMWVCKGGWRECAANNDI